MREALNLNFVSAEEVVLRIALAIAFGFIIGYERDSKNKPIDFRAYMIVAMSSCLIAVMGLELQQGDGSSIELAKLIAGTLTGIGFLGAGAIMKTDGDKKPVIGTATGASVWASGAMGLCLGFGLYFIAFVGFVAVALILFVGGLFVGKVAGNADKDNADYVDDLDDNNSDQ